MSSDTPRPADGIYLVGVATADITPAVGVSLSGYAIRGPHTSTAIERPLRATVLLVSDGETSIALVGLDLVGCGNLAPRLRDVVAEAAGVAVTNVVAVASHTHCGPTIERYDQHPHLEADLAYTDVLLDRLATAARAARTNLQPARLSYGVGSCSIAMSRRLPDPARPDRCLTPMTPYPEGVTSADVGVLVVRSLDDVVRSVVFSYGCHPTLRKSLRVSGDYVSFAYDVIEEALRDAQPLFLQGCGGDQKAYVGEFTGRWPAGRLDQVEDAGTQLGEAVVAAVADAAPLRGPLGIAAQVLTLTTEPVDPDRLRTLASSGTPLEQGWATDLLRRLDDGTEIPTQHPFELACLTVGRDLALVAMGGEMTIEHAIRLRRDLTGPFRAVLPVGYLGRIIGYIPVRRQIPEGGYEVEGAPMYQRLSGPFVAETEDTIHHAAAALLGVG